MKPCIKCKEIKPIDSFYKHPQMKDGHLNKCIECCKKDSRANIKKKNDYYKEYDKLRSQLPHRIEARKEYQSKHKEKINEYKKRYEVNNKNKKHAVVTLNNAVRDKRIFKQPCCFCGDEKVQAHHEDYSKPLDVVWLCSKCHAKFHSIKRIKEEDKKVS